ncbi:hypothetical protein [Bradyrhizobium sp. CB2312]|uniref:hypothetical protein n=1 Tax=Bradyrhizobium sp. CB2312 TaxID=3039155 RepID=UPI0011601BF1|nr:hypothetical protein [Bradyrhizobium sp. CB2312]WFU71055.1 hypothetical protein QA642_38245 [Bradyrhizobium sp. CB2312]
MQLQKIERLAPSLKNSLLETCVRFSGARKKLRHPSLQILAHIARDSWNKLRQQVGRSPGDILLS